MHLARRSLRRFKGGAREGAWTDPSFFFSPDKRTNRAAHYKLRHTTTSIDISNHLLVHLQHARARLPVGARALPHGDAAAAAARDVDVGVGVDVQEEGQRLGGSLGF